MTTPHLDTEPAAPEPCLTLEELIPRLRPRLKSIFFRYRIPPHETEDIVQEALLAALRKWDSILNKEAWVLGTIRIQCTIYWKRQRLSMLQAVDAGSLEFLSVPIPPPQEREEMVWDLETLASGLSPRHRAVLWLRYGLGLSNHEVAEKLGYCPASVRKLTGRFLERLQRALAEDDPARLSA
jgi:RNA polymerase sigma factor (sigma-70 family)